MTAGTLLKDADPETTCNNVLNRQIDLQWSGKEEFVFGDHSGNIFYYPYTQVGGCVFDGTNIAVLLTQRDQFSEVDGIVKSFKFAE